MYSHNVSSDRELALNIGRHCYSTRTERGETDEDIEGVVCADSSFEVLMEGHDNAAGRVTGANIRRPRSWLRRADSDFERDVSRTAPWFSLVIFS